MFDANGELGGTDDGIAEDARVLGYDPMIPPALIQQEIPTVLAPLTTPFRWPMLIWCSLPSH
jgi:hypothetical protein